MKSKSQQGLIKISGSGATLGSDCCLLAVSGSACVVIDMCGVYWFICHMVKVWRDKTSYLHLSVLAISIIYTSSTRLMIMTCRHLRSVHNIIQGLVLRQPCVDTRIDLDSIPCILCIASICPVEKI